MLTWSVWRGVGGYSISRSSLIRSYILLDYWSSVRARPPERLPAALGHGHSRGMTVCECVAGVGTYLTSQGGDPISLSALFGDAAPTAMRPRAHSAQLVRAA